MTDDEMKIIFYMNTLGLTIIYDTFIHASKMMIPYYKRNTGGVVYECYMFIQGTGLDVLIKDYGMDYDPEKLRNSFNWYMRKFDNERTHFCHHLSS